MLTDITITDIKSVFAVTSSKGRYDTITKRKYYGLSFCTDGQIIYNHNGNEVMSDKNHAVILPQGKTYTLSGIKNGVFPVINFTCIGNLCDTVTAIPVRDTKELIRDFEKLRSLSLFEGNRSEMMSVFYHMLHRLSLQNPPCYSILPAVKYIEKNYRNPELTNEELAAQCNISEVYFRRLFTKHYNMTPKQFIIDMRINKAKQLLAEGILKINNIAGCCGFSNQYHFCRSFKEKTGLTPTEYMKQNKIYRI